MTKVSYQPLTPDYFAEVIYLGNAVHGDNYLDYASMHAIYLAGISNQINASWLALAGEKLVGFRLTLATKNWQTDKWCSPQLWAVKPQKVCYFKCNTVDSEFRGLGIGSAMLAHSVNSAKQQGALAGLAHIWLASPNNSAFKYFTKNGGKLIQEHPNKWLDSSLKDGYICPVCGNECHCVAAEMLLTFL